MPETYTPPFKPRAQQLEALRRMEGQEAFALFMAMRVGKTKCILDDFGRLELAGTCQDLLVVAPGGVFRTWKGACEEHLSIDLRGRVKVHVWESGGGAGHDRALKAFMATPSGPRILLINVEALSAVKRARDTVLAFAQASKTMGVIDEATVIKNSSSIRTKFINGRLSQHLEYRRILSGLPTPKSPLDLYGEMEFLDWRILGYRSYYAFRARYAVMFQAQFGGRTVPIVKGYRDLDDLQARIAPYSYRVRLDECYDLPAKTYFIREVGLTAEQSRLYKQMKEFATTQLDSGEHVTATVVIAQIIRLHQILCGHTRDEDGAWHDIPELRTGALMAALSDFDGKAIIWCSYDRDIIKVSAALAKEFGDESVARFWGGNVRLREAEEARFLKNSDCRFMVATAAAGGRGRTWTVASLVVYYSNTNDLEHRSQSEERPQAVGKADPVAYIDLAVPGTVDEKIIHALRNKIDLASAITGDGYRAWLV